MNDSANSSLEALVLGIPYVILCFIFLPLYFMVIWVLSVNPIFEGSIFYRILKHMAVANAMSLNSTFMGGLFELSQSTFSDFISITSGSLSSWFKVAICLLHILLSINRFSVVFGFHIPFENDIHQYSIFLMWYALAVLLIMTPYLKLEFEYQLDRHWFKEPSELLEKPIDHARHVVSFIYIIVILKYFCSVGTLIRS
ncbi:hypothetical protein L596_014390 [Steinernema carpocapsae]|uniref:Uncharacterized protein n=1 Tax=Steinernema carpocapsae TaxID=34508 RepID=A0A4U5NC06_STECR|nr:hypothetical protein L596_014390 [Steinernema carpocapsae]